MNFEQLNIEPIILKALAKENYSEPTPIQQHAIPLVLQGRDILGCAQTGTGKTAAFAIPTIQILHNEPIVGKKKLRALVVTPTRELAQQIYENFLAYSRYTNITSCVIFGGVSQKPQETQLQKGVDILIATPGRLNDLLNQNLIKLDDIKIFILDEADRMLDMGFINDIKRIIKKLPMQKQTLLFSATMPNDISDMANSLLVNPAKVSVTPVSSTVDTIQQSVYFTDKENKKHLLEHLLKDKSIESVLVFTRTKHGADKIAKQLMKKNITAQAIHGDKSQNSRQNSLNNFKNKNLRVLVATDLAARGIDISELSHVINFDLPNIPETYVHRIGRTGRAGLSGIAISFCDFDEKPLLSDIEKLMSKKIDVVNDNPYPMLNNFPAVKNTQPRPSRAKSTVSQQPSKKHVKKAKKEDVLEKKPHRIKEDVKTLTSGDKHKTQILREDKKTVAHPKDTPVDKNAQSSRKSISERGYSHIKQGKNYYQPKKPLSEFFKD